MKCQRLSLGKGYKHLKAILSIFSRRAEFSHGAVEEEWRAVTQSFYHRKVVIFDSPLVASTVGKPFILSASLPSSFYHHILLQAPEEIQYSAHIPPHLTIYKSQLASLLSIFQRFPQIVGRRFKLTRKLFHRIYGLMQRGILSHLFTYIPR